MKISYKMSWRRHLKRRSRGILLFLLFIVFARILLHTFSWRFKFRNCEMKLARRAAVSLMPETSKLPCYEIVCPASQEAKLQRPAWPDISIKAPKRSWANAVVSYREYRPKYVARLGEARIRYQGYSPAVPGTLKKNLRIRFADKSVVGTDVVRLFCAETKDCEWYVFHMELAKRLGLLVPKCRFVRVKYNGIDCGLSVEMEPFGAAMLARYGLSNADFFGELDDVPFVAYRRVYDSVGRWRKYDPPPGREGEFGIIDEFIRLIDESDETVFHSEIFNYLDLDNIVAWHVHMAIMDSYHQGGCGNVRIAVDNVTGKLIFIPWDALPVHGFQRLKHHALYFPAAHALTLRLMMNPTFLREYSRCLYETADDLLLQLDGIFAGIYTDDVRNAIEKDHYREDVFFEAFRGPGIIGKSRSFLNWWERYVDVRKKKIRHTCEELKWTMENAQLFVLLDNSGIASREHQMKLSFEGQSPVMLSTVTVPLKSYKTFRESKISVRIRLVPEPDSTRVRYRHRRHDIGLTSQEVTVVGSMKGGYLVLENCNMILMPNYPKLEGEINSLTGTGVLASYRDFIRPQEFIMHLEFDSVVPIDVTKMKLATVNCGTGDPCDCHYRFYNRQQHSLRRLRSRSAEETASMYDWLKYDADSKRLVVSSDTVMVSQTVIVPEGTALAIPRGVEFQMAAGASLISFSPLLIKGTEERPVCFVPATEGEKWGVLAVVNTRGESHLSNVTIRGADSARILDIDFTGALNFHSAPYKLENCKYEQPGNTNVRVIRKKGRAYCSD